MPANSCRWGILSTALIGRKNWQAIRMSGNAVVAAVASRDLARSKEFIDECQQLVPFEQIPVPLGNYQELVDHPDIDAVYVPLPTGLRKEWVIRAAQAGKHVLCEKPCAVSHEDLQEMIEACANNGVQFMDGVMYMHTDRLARMRQVLDDGQSIGKLKRIATQFSFCAPEEFKADNIRTDASLEPHGCLGDLGWYTIRFALWAMQYQLPVSVTGRILTEFQRDESNQPVPLEFSGELFFDGGVSAVFYNSFVTEHQQWASLSGTAGQLSVQDFVLPYHSNCLEFQVHQPAFQVYGCDFNMERNTQFYSTQEYSSSAANAAETNLFRRFSEIVASGQLQPEWPVISLKTQQVLDACFRSAKSGSQPVAL